MGEDCEVAAWMTQCFPVCRDHRVELGTIQTPTRFFDIRYPTGSWAHGVITYRRMSSLPVPGFSITHHIQAWRKRSGIAEAQKLVPLLSFLRR